MSSATHVAQPQNIEAEEAVLGSVLIDPDVFRELDLQASDFYAVKHQWIWAACQSLTMRGEPIDLLTVQSALGERAADMGGPAYLTRLITAVPSAWNAAAYARQVKDAAMRRSLLRLASDMAKAAYDADSAIADAIPAMVDRLVRAVVVGDGAVPYAQIIGEFYDIVERASKDPEAARTSISTGFADVDKALGGGLKRKRFYVLSGEPGKGKTLFAMQAAAQMALTAPGAIYELEMSREEMAARAVSARTGISTERLESGDLSDDEWPVLLSTMQELERLPIWFSDSTHWTTASLRADLARLKASHGIQWFVVDYLKLLNDRYGKEDYEREGYMSRQIKHICRELDLAGLVIHSMTKAGMQATMPDMEHLSGGASIPFDCDSVMFLTEHIPANDETYSANMRTITWAKMRYTDVPAPVHLVKRPHYPAFGDARRETAAPAPATMHSSNGRRRPQAVELVTPYKDD